MNIHGKILISLCFFIAGIMLFASEIQSDTILAAYGEYHTDQNMNMVVCNTGISTYDDLSGFSSLYIRFDEGTVYKFNPLPSGLKTGGSYKITANNINYDLFFTGLPLIHIQTEYNIGNEPKVPATFIISDSNETFSSYIGIERRGGISQHYPKKSYDLELWKDASGHDTINRSLLSMRNDDDWLLMAMWNEPLRLRNVVSHELWLKIYTLYYQEEEPKAVPGIHTRYAELFLNGEYMGIYILTEPVDRKQLKQKKFLIDNPVIRGQLFKALSWGEAATYDGAPPFNNSSRLWSGFEMKYPKEEEITDWNDLYNLVNLVVNGSDDDFLRYMPSMFNIENAVDYFLFLNILRGTDNRGKNIYVSRYDIDEQFINIPWDLDGTWGMFWNGTRQDITDDIFSNGMFDRLMNLDNNFFNLLLRERWNTLRQNEFDKIRLMEMFEEKYNILHLNGAYTREKLKWGDNTLDLQNIFYLNTWLTKRLAFLDDYFPPLNTGNADAKLLNSNYFLYPNPTSEYIIIRKRNTSTAYYEIYSVMGKLVKSGKISDLESRINLEDLNTGVYILKISEKNQQTSGNLRFIKE